MKQFRFSIMIDFYCLHILEAFLEVGEKKKICKTHIYLLIFKKISYHCKVLRAFCLCNGALKTLYKFLG